MEKTYEIYIKTTPEKLWKALTDPEQRKKYTFGVDVKSDWKKGSKYTGTAGSTTVSPGTPILEGEILDIEPNKKIVQSFRALWSEEVKREGTSRVTYLLEPIQDTVKLTVIHDEMPENVNEEIYGGEMMVLSGLKTLLETGQTLTTPGSLMYTPSTSH